MQPISESGDVFPKRLSKQQPLVSGQESQPPSSSSVTTTTAVATTSPLFLFCRRFALVVEGMTQGLILPFGPHWIQQLVRINVDTKTYNWTENKRSFMFCFTLLVLSSVAGRSVGRVLVRRYSLLPTVTANHHGEKNLSRVFLTRRAMTFARVGGLAVALLLYTSVYCLYQSSPIFLFLIIRFLSVSLAAWLSGATHAVNLPGDKTTEHQDRFESWTSSKTLLSSSLFETLVLLLSGLVGSIVLSELLMLAIHPSALTTPVYADEGFSYAAGFLMLAAAAGAELLLRFYLWTILARDERLDAPFAADVSYPRRDNLEEAGASALLLHTPPRSRNSSSMSQLEDEFHDCVSMASDVETGWEAKNELENVVDYHKYDDIDEDHRVAFYINKRCVCEDGRTPAFVPVGDTPARLPANYLDYFHGNRDRAIRAWRASQIWRMENDVWRIHTLRNKWFNEIKEAYPHYVHGYSKEGYPVVYEQPGRMNLKELFRNGCKVSDMVHHYIYFLEFIANHICTKPEIKKCKKPAATGENPNSWGILVVMDVEGAGLSHLSGDVIKYLKQAGEVNSAHYPLSLKRAFLVNSPFWLSGAWSGIKGILPDSVQVDILSDTSYPDTLRMYIDEDQIPPEYSGTSTYKLGEHPYEFELRKLVAEVELDHEKSECQYFTPSIDKTTQLGAEVDISEVIDQATKSSSFHSPTRKSSLRRRGSQEDTASSIANLLVRARKDTVPSLTKFLVRAREKGTGLVTNIDFFTIISITHFLRGSLQGALQAFIPLWIMSPAVRGGLGYLPLQSGTVIVGTAILLFLASLTRSSSLITRLPGISPMSAFRIGGGVQSMSLFVLAAASSLTNPLLRKQSIIFMFFTMIALGWISVATLVSQSGSTILHRIAAEKFSKQKTTFPNFFVDWYGPHQLVTDLQSGHFTTIVNIVAEITGVIIVAPIISWSFANGRSAPLNGVFVLFLSSLFALVLFLASFSLNFDVYAGDFLPRPDSLSDTAYTTKYFSRFFGDTFALPVDMDILLEEANWTKPSFRVATERRSRVQSSDDAGDSMERGTVCAFEEKAK